uniref:Uncharacterized protein n=1 Tax=Caenorhabditis japonica TaxID=281687 RepID=A0A8R1DT71_CAEJA
MSTKKNSQAESQVENNSVFELTNDSTSSKESNKNLVSKEIVLLQDSTGYIVGEIRDYYSSDDEDLEPIRQKECVDEIDPAVFWRIKFRNHNRFPWAQLFVKQSTSIEEVQRTLSLLDKGSQGQTFARNFQFRHDLNEQKYKNKYIIQIDPHRIEFDEIDDGTLVNDDTVSLGTLETYHGRNKALEGLIKVLKMNLHVHKVYFESNRVEQMGEIDLSEYENSVTAEVLTIEMDSVKNVTEIIKAHVPPLAKLTLVCRVDFRGIVNLKQVRTAMLLKLDGESKMTDKDLLTLEAVSLEVESEEITSKGLNDLIKDRLTREIPDRFFALVQGSNFNAKEVLKGLEHKKYQDIRSYAEKNGSLSFDFPQDNSTFAHVKIHNSEERLVVCVCSYRFECFKESKRYGPISHEYDYID